MQAEYFFTQISCEKVRVRSPEHERNFFVYLPDSISRNDKQKHKQRELKTAMDSNLYQQLKEFGFTDDQILDALTSRSFDTIESAVAFILEQVDNKNQESVSSSSSTTGVAQTTLANSEPPQQQLQNQPKFYNEEHKMILVVRDDLKMGKGKIAAQCCHAAVGVYRKIIFSGNDQWKLWLKTWEDIAEAKVAVKCNSERDIDDLERKAIDCGLPTMLIVDAGRTQIAPNSKTVLGIGPAPVSVINQVTSHLKLL